MADINVINRLWTPAQPVWETLRGWKHPPKRKFNELNDADRKILLEACLELIMIDDHAAQFVREKIVDGLSEDLSAEVYNRLGMDACSLAIDEPVMTASLLAVDLITMFIERDMDRGGGAKELTDMLQGPIRASVCERQYQLGITCPDTPFRNWRQKERDRMVKPLCTLIMRGMKRSNDPVHNASVAAADDALIRTFHHQQKVSKQLEEDVRIAVGAHIFNLARRPDEDVDTDRRPKGDCFGLTHLPPSAIPFVFTYIAKETEENGGQVARIFAQLEDELARALMDAWTEQEEEATAEPSAD